MTQTLQEARCDLCQDANHRAVAGAVATASYAYTDTTVLILGETGRGNERIARTIQEPSTPPGARFSASTARQCRLRSREILGSGILLETGALSNCGIDGSSFGSSH